MGQLVPQRRFPLELARPGFRRIERDDTPEADAKRIQHARQAGDPHGEIVVLGKELDENRALGRELVARGEAVERLMRQRNRVLLEEGGLVLLEPENQIAVADGDEFVERVQQAEHVVGRLVVRIELERGFERLSRARLVAGAKQVRAKIRERPGVLRLQLDSPPQQSHRFVESVVVGRQLPDDAVDLAVGWSDREHLRHLGLEVALLVLDIGERRQGRMRVEAVGFDGERLLQRLAGFVFVVLVERSMSKEDVRLGVRRVDLERLLGGADGLWRVIVGQRNGGTEQRRRPRRIGAEGDREQFERIGVLVGVEVQLAPLRVHLGILRRPRRRAAECVVGLLELAERAERPRRDQQILGLRGHPVQDRRGVGTPQHLAEQPKLQRRDAHRLACGGRSQKGLGVGVSSARCQRASLQRGGRWIGLAELVRQPLDLVVAPFEERAGRLLKRRLAAAARLGRGGHAQHGHAKNGSDRNDERQRAPTSSKWRHVGIIT